MTAASATYLFFLFRNQALSNEEAVTASTIMLTPCHIAEGVACAIVAKSAFGNSVMTTKHKPEPAVEVHEEEGQKMLKILLNIHVHNICSVLSTVHV